MHLSKAFCAVVLALCGAVASTPIPITNVASQNQIDRRQEECVGGGGSWGVHDEGGGGSWGSESESSPAPDTGGGGSWGSPDVEVEGTWGTPESEIISTPEPTCYYPEAEPYNTEPANNDEESPLDDLVSHMMKDLGKLAGKGLKELWGEFIKTALEDPHNASPQTPPP